MDAKDLDINTLNEQQLLMLRLFKKPMPKDAFLQIRQLAIRLLADQLDEVIGEWEEKNGITKEYYEQMAYSHFRSKSNK